MITAAAGRRGASGRQRLDEDVRRAQIMAATVTVVARHGFSGASVGMIADLAGVSKGLVWHYFADKNDLMRQTVLATGVAIRDGIAAQLDLSAPVPDILRAAIRTAAHLGSTHQEELSALSQITRSLRNDDGTPAFDLKDYEEAYQAQETLFRRGQDEGTLRAFDTRVMAVTYQGAIDMMLGYVESHPDTDIDGYADSLADLLLTGIIAPAKRRPKTPAHNPSITAHAIERDRH